VDTNARIIAGHGRLLAARKVDLGEIPVVVLDHLSETQRRAYVIADNKLAMNAGWAEATLAEWYVELVLLRMLAFSGEYSDRTKAQRWVGAVELVPWVKA